jgi:hypothetical protein
MGRALHLSSCFDVPGKLWMGALALKTATLVGATGSCLAEESSMTERNSVKVGGKSER